MAKRIGRRGMLTGAAALLAASIMAPALQAADGLTVFDWAGYDDPNFHQAYTARYSTPPSFTFFADDDEGFQKARAGFKADLAHPCLTTAAKWREAGLIQPIDTARIAAWNDIIPALKELPGVVQDGKVWMVPFDWGNALLIVRTDQVPEADRTLDIFTNPRYKGRIAVSGSVDDAYALAMLALGMQKFEDLNDPAKFQQASDYLAKVRDNQKFYWTDPTQLDQSIASGEIVAAWAWNQSVTAGQGNGVPVEAVTGPKAGASTWVCGYVDMVDGPGSKDLAYDYLNALLDPSAGKYILEAWGYGHSNGKSFAVADKAAVARFGYDDLERFMTNSLFQAGIGVELQQKLADQFEKIKSGF
ncbi:ABC transporter substrate-binding protein [Hypericibacter adhaerens]|jgi:spermidine/putrescine-binding protein|nr:extracellular solute-binding protein [Hypericibacter adhaerens]